MIPTERKLAHQLKMETKRQGLWPDAQPQKPSAAGIARRIGLLKGAMRRGELVPKRVVPSPLLETLMVRAGMKVPAKPASPVMDKLEKAA